MRNIGDAGIATSGWRWLSLLRHGYGWLATGLLAIGFLLGALGGVSLVMQCPAERLPNPVYRAIDMVDGRKKNPVDLSGHMHDEHEKYGWWNSARQANPVEQDAAIDTSSADAMRETLTQILDDDVAAFESGDRPDYHGVWPVILDANVARPPQDADDDGPASSATATASGTERSITPPPALRF